MKPLHLIRPPAALSLLVWLVACTSAPPFPSGAAANASLATVTTPMTVPAAITAPADFSVVSEPFSTSTEAPRPALLAGEVAHEFERGGASWYGPGFHGRLTASGERFDMQALTAAHRTLAFGTMVRVHSLVNGREVDVRITDRGPFSGSRVIDLSRAAAQELDMLGLGFKEVVLMVPESTLAAARPLPVAPVKKRVRPARRTSRASVR